MRFEKNGNTIIAYFTPPVNGLDMIVLVRKRLQHGMPYWD